LLPENHATVETVLTGKWEGKPGKEKVRRPAMIVFSSGLNKKNGMFKSFPLFIVVLLVLTGQVFSQSEELPLKHIPEVTVVKSNRDFFSDDYPTFSIDHPLQISPQQNLGYLLERESPAFIKSYGGAGSLVSLSLHGTGSNHTQINWNGFPLNSPTTGQADLSLIPSGFIQTIEIINGASGALFGSGTFGGSINLANEPDWNNRIAIDYSMNAGSFGTFGNSLLFRTGNRRIQYHASVISSQVENDFSYRDYYKFNSPIVKASHNAFRTWGFIQNVYLNMGRGNYLEAGIWYQRKTKELPRLMGSYHENNAVQKDSLFRSYISYRKTTERSALVVKSAYFSDFIQYSDKLFSTDSSYSLNSKIASNRLMNEADYRYYISSSLILGGGISYNLSTGNSGNYGGKIREQDYAVFGNLKIRLKDWIFNTGVRKVLYNNMNPPLQYSLGIRYKATDRLILRTSLSSKFRKPTFNEKYWRPGGNPGLNPERGWGGEAGTEWALTDKPGNILHLEVILNAYFQHVDNWIQWVMRDSLTPVEYKKVHASGIESTVNFDFPAGMVLVKGCLGYSFNRSVIVDTYNHNPLYNGKQMMYIPKHMGKANISANYNGFMLGAGALLTGSRETVETADRTFRLDPYATMDLIGGMNHKIFGVNFGLYCRVDNVFNKQYEVIRSYPMPGRSIVFTMTLGLDRSNPDQ
jgi:vitamin B12 transporter